MAKAPQLDLQGKKAKDVTLEDAVFAAEVKPHLVHEVVRAELNAQRAGTSATKSRGLVSGGRAKPWRQKGTGRARQGSTRSPQWRHGGVVFGPNGRRYKQRMPAKMRHAAFAEALSAQAASGRMFIVDELRFDGDRPRARDVIEWLGRVGETGRALLVTAETDERVGRATANLKEFGLRTPGTLRLEDILGAETVLVLRPALGGLAARATVGSAE